MLHRLMEALRLKAPQPPQEYRIIIPLMSHSSILLREYYFILRGMYTDGY